MAQEQIKVTILPENTHGTFPSRTHLSKAAAQMERSTLGSCGGRVKCTGCAVKFANAVNGIPVQPMKDQERELLKGQGFPIDGTVRLSCLVRPFGDVAFEHVGKETGDHVIEKSAKVLDIETDSAITLRTVSSADALEDLLYDDGIETEIADTLSKQDTVTIAIYENDDGTKTAINVYAEEKERVYGIACDIGTTTIAMHLCDLESGKVVASASAVNPQIDYGADVISRISQIQTDPENLERMTKLVRNAINELITRVCEQADINRSDILDSVFVGNPTMRHVFMGKNPEHLGSMPSEKDIAVGNIVDPLPATINSAKDFDINLGRGARSYILPELSGHVGADATAALLATGIHESDETILLIDVGTNAEMFLGNKDGIVSASTPAAPAFEGAELSCGQRASKGAIEAVKIDPSHHEIYIKVIGEERWSYDPEFPQDTHVTGICGSGVIDLFAEMHRNQMLGDTGGILPNASAITAGSIVQNEGGETFSCVIRDGKPPITLLPGDVNSFMFVKAAIRSGIEILKKETGTTSIDKIYVAGGFGAHINLDNAAALGIFPKEADTKLAAIGNAAGDGAYMALVNKGQRKAIKEITGQSQHIEIATHPDREELYIDAGYIPYGAPKTRRRGGRRARLEKNQ